MLRRAGHQPRSICSTHNCALCCSKSVLPKAYSTDKNRLCVIKAGKSFAAENQDLNQNQGPTELVLTLVIDRINSTEFVGIIFQELKNEW